MMVTYEETEPCQGNGGQDLGLGSLRSRGASLVPTLGDRPP